MSCETDEKKSFACASESASLVHLVGLEPTRLSAMEPKSIVSAISPQVRQDIVKYYLFPPYFSLCARNVLTLFANALCSGNVPPETSF